MSHKNLRVSHKLSSQRFQPVSGTPRVRLPSFNYQNVSSAKYLDCFQFLNLINALNSLTVSYFTHRGCFRGIWFFRFVARHQISVRRNVLNQLQQSGARVRTRPHMDSVVRHAQFHLRVTLNKTKMALLKSLDDVILRLNTLCDFTTSTKHSLQY